MAKAGRYTVQIVPAVRKELDALPRKQRAQVEGRIAALADDPRPVGYQPLKGKQFEGLSRIRSGDFRIIYRIQDQKLIVLVVAIGNRRDVYR